MGGLMVIIYLFLGMVMASAAVSALERGRYGWVVFFTAASLFNLFTYFHAIQS